MSHADIAALHPRSFSLYQDLAETGSFAERQHTVRQEDENAVGAATMFVPFRGIHFGVCGPVALRARRSFPVALDIPVTAIILTVSGAVRYEAADGSAHECAEHEFLVADLVGFEGETVLDAGQTHCHIEFFLERNALEANFGREAARNMAAALERRVPASPVAPVRLAKGMVCAAGIALANRVLAAREDSSVGSLEMRGLCLELLSLLLKNLSHGDATEAPCGNSREIAALYRLKEDIERRFLEDDSLDDFCRKAGIAPLRAGKEFKRLFQVGPGRYRVQCRLARAHELLRSGAVNVSECAWAVGYSNISHFVAMFKEHFGITPGSLAGRQTRNS